MHTTHAIEIERQRGTRFVRRTTGLLAIAGTAATALLAGVIGLESKTAHATARATSTVIRARATSTSSAPASTSQSTSATDSNSSPSAPTASSSAPVVQSGGS